MRNATIGSLIFNLFLGVAGLAGCANSNPSYSSDGRQTDGGADLSGTTADLAGVACQLVPQTGCVASQKCTTHDAVTTLCDPDGNVNRGERCTVQASVDTCYAGNACANAGGGIGLCRTFCRTDGDCGTRSYCELPLGTAGVRLCTQSCNALGAGCPPGLACYPYDAEHTDCRLAGTALEGQPCSRPEDCQASMACLGPAGAERCRVLCQRGVSGGCQSPKVCSTVTYQGTPWPTYGVCL